MKRITSGILAFATALSLLPGAVTTAQATPNVPNNLGPDQWVTCAAIIPGSGTPGRRYYAWWNPGWPAPHNTIGAAIAICNQWYGGTGPAIPPAANTPHTGPYQYSPPRSIRLRSDFKVKEKAIIIPQPEPGCGSPSGIQNQNTC
jgi:hypothetical protein